MATIKEIALLAGVSRGTVDRVLNNRGNVNAETEARIRKIAKQLDYKPNPAGTILAAQRKQLKIGVVLLGLGETPESGNPFYEEVCRGVLEKARALEDYNCTVIVKQTPYSVEAQIDAIAELLREGVSGIAMTPINDKRIRTEIEVMYEAGIPVVTLNTDIEESKRLAYVGTNYYKSGETAAGLMHLITRGEIYVGIISGSQHILCHTERIAGFTDTIQRRYPNIHISSSITNQDDDFESYEMTSRLLRSHPEINALYFAAGGVLGGCRAVIDSGRQYDIQAITYDNIPATAQLMEQGLIAATICQQPQMQGSWPLDLLFQYLTTGQKPTQEYHYLDVDIRIRENIF